jgi:hypothetical protein
MRVQIHAGVEERTRKSIHAAAADPCEFSA